MANCFTMIKNNRSVVKAIIIIILSYLISGTGYAVEAKSETITTVILIRHAERDNFFILTPKGHERAEALVDAVGDMGIVAIYSPDLERNLDTVRPLSKHLGVAITLIPRISKKTVDGIVSQILARHSGDVVLLVGNGSGNLRALHQRLGGTGESPYTYGELFIYTIPVQGPIKVIKYKYGS
jgi:hypothetical protein